MIQGSVAVPDEVQEWMLRYIESVRWREAKSGPPHSYTVRKWDSRPGRFEEAVTVIRRYGHPEHFYSETYIYMTIGKLKYWSMGAPVGETIIINRAGKETSYGAGGGEPIAQAISPTEASIR